MKKAEVLKSVFPYFMGVVLISIGYLPYILLRENCVIKITDQLDGEIIAYILNSKHLFDGNKTFVEIMGGMDRNALIVPSLFSVLYYVAFSPLDAFLIQQYIMIVFAFCGMFLLNKYITNSEIIAFFVAMIFAYLPFFSVYGLSIAGIPILVYSLCKLYEDNSKHDIVYYGIILFYCFNSSFVLIGYAITGIVVLMSLIFAIKRIKKKRTFVAAGLISLSYIIQNYSLFLQILQIGDQEKSHKEEWVIQPMDFWQGTKLVFWDGIDTAGSYHKFIIIPALIVAIYGCICYKKITNKNRKELCILCSLLFLAFTIALFYGWFHCADVVSFRNRIGGIVKYFQFDRFYWLYPTIWYVILAVTCSLIWDIIKKKSVKLFICISILFLTAIFVVWNSNFKKNFREIIGSNTSNQITWNDFFSEEQFAEIENYIYQEHGLRKSEYRVISLGIQPAVSLYNGFYTLDGYSNNYSLEYKHEFYKIMSQELEENNSNYIYFQNWGNRCYLFASDYNGVPNLGKGNFPVYTDFTIDTSQIYEMGGRYIISAGEIVNPQLTGLELCQVFEDLDWYYKIYLYRIIVEE